VQSSKWYASTAAPGEVGVHYEALPLNVAAAIGAAIPNIDYTPVSGTLTFADGVVSRTFEVPILEDTLAEPSELLGLRLSEPTGGATLGTANALLTIIDNDKPPSTSTVQFNPCLSITSRRMLAVCS
jgi:hypothetical protein